MAIASLAKRNAAAGSAAIQRPVLQCRSLGRSRARVARVVHAAIAKPPTTKTDTSSAVPTVSSQDPAPLSVSQVHQVASSFKFDARAFADAEAVKPLIPSIRMYGELCECTYANYLSVRNDGVTPIPPTPFSADKPAKLPSLLDKIVVTATGTQEEIDQVAPLKVPALPEELFLAPHPAFTPDTAATAVLPSLPAKFPYTDEQLGGRYGFLQSPDSLIVEADFRVSQYLYASSGIFDSSDSPDEVYWIGYIAYSAKLKEIVVVFRGTVHASEWQQNADLKAITITDKLPELKQDELTGDNADNILVHQGFYEMYYTDFKPPSFLSRFFTRVASKQQALEKQVRAGLLHTLDLLREAETEEAEGNETFTLTITGHSLGGALATVAAYDIMHDYQVAAAWPGGIDGLRSSMQGVTWAQPKVGNEAFFDDFHKKIPAARWMRILNDGDIVPLLPLHTLPEIRELADNVFSVLRVTGDGNELKREQKLNKELVDKAKTALEAVDLTEDVVSLFKEVKEDWIENKDGTKSRTCSFKHLGWELRFDPDHPKFDYVATTGHTKNKIVNLIASTVEMLAESTRLVEDIPSLEDNGTRHNLDVLMHMLDPSTDKVLLNKKRKILIEDRLSEEERTRLGGRYIWWSPYEQSGLRLVKQEDGSHKWTCVQK